MQNQSTKIKLHKIKQEVNRYELLLQMSLEFYNEKRLDKLLYKIWSRLTEVMDAERSSLFLIDEDRNELWSKIAQKAGEIRFPVGKGIAGIVAKDAKTINITNAYNDPRFNPEFDRKIHFRTSSVLAVPLVNRIGKVIGVSEVINKKGKKSFNKKDEVMLQAISNIAAIAIENAQLQEDQKHSLNAAIEGLNTSLEIRDPSSTGHAFFVKELSCILAKKLGFGEDDIEVLGYAAALHDFGKIGVPDAVIMKKTPLNQAEKGEYELHALKTKIYLESMDFKGRLKKIPLIAPFNHKRLDGTGYPAGEPEGENIPFESRIIAVADTLHVLMSEKFGRKPLNLHDALKEIKKDTGKGFDKRVVKALFDIKPELATIVRKLLISDTKVQTNFNIST